MKTPRPIRMVASISHGPRFSARRPAKKLLMSGPPNGSKMTSVSRRYYVGIASVRFRYGSFAHRPEGNAPQQVFAQQDGKDHHGQQEDGGACRHGGPVEAAHADDGRDEGRCGLCRAGGQQDREGVFVPGKDQAEDRGGGDAGGRLRQDHFVEGLKPCVAVDQCRLFVFAGNLVNEALEQPDGKRDVHGCVEQDHAQMRVGEAELSVH
mmetsp:Transcript_127/g.403  ORF Transcript_127/g.403 Transcript_127/m.403 type:complete len:208 (+) Transcript_127:797-1420(+)